MTHYSTRRGEVGHRPLSAREMEVLRAYARFGTQKVVAHKLGISPQTVKNHLTSAYRKLEVSGGMEAFFALGWVHPPDDVAMELRRAVELRAELLEIASEAGAIASRLGDLLEGTA